MHPTCTDEGELNRAPVWLPLYSLGLLEPGTRPVLDATRTSPTSGMPGA